MRIRPWHIVIGLLLVLALTAELVRQLMDLGVR